MALATLAAPCCTFLRVCRLGGGRFTCGPFPSFTHAQRRSSLFLSFFLPPEQASLRLPLTLPPAAGAPGQQVTAAMALPLTPPLMLPAAPHAAPCAGAPAAMALPLTLHLLPLHSSVNSLLFALSPVPTHLLPLLPALLLSPGCPLEQDRRPGRRDCCYVPCALLPSCTCCC